MEALERDRVQPDTPVQLCDSLDWDLMRHQLRRERIARLRGVEPRYGNLGLSSDELRSGFRSVADRLVDLSQYTEEEIASWKVTEVE